MRFLVCLTFAVGAAILAGAIPARSQDKPEPAAINKRKTAELLEKAADEYRIFFKRPETTFEYWAAIKFEMDLGKFDLAALHLKLMLEKDAKEVDPDLVKLEEAEGMSAFLRLEKVRPKDWSDHPPFQEEAVKNVETLLQRVTKAVENHLSDPVRIRKYIGRLEAPTPEERAYAFVQIARSRERAVPYLVEALRQSFGKPAFSRIKETLLRMGPETVPVYLEVLKAANDKDYTDLELRLTVLDIVKQRDDKRAAPYLWHMSASKKYPDAVRKKAKEVLASLLRIDVTDLPPAKESLTLLAERFYQHKMAFPADKGVKIWEWDGQSIATTPTELTPYRAEEFLGTRYAKEALDLEPGYQPAQVVLLSFLLERNYRDKVDKILMEPLPPKMQQLLTSLDADLMMRVLERGMEDKQLPVILPLIQALGERGEYRAARVGSGEQPRGLARALYYPDRRVQYAGMLAMLRMPNPGTPAASERIVELARRFLASEQKAKALVVHTPTGAEPAVRQICQGLGLEAVLAKTPKEAVDKARASADFDLVILHRGLNDKEVPFAYAQLRKDNDLAGLPIIVVVDNAREKAVKKLVARDPGVLVIAEERFKAGDDLKTLVDEHFRAAQVVKLTPNERKLFGNISMDILWRMARGEVPGYNVGAALDVVKAQVGSPENGLPALEILGRLPGRENQSLLARIVADPNQDLKAVRLPAVFELNRHMQKYMVLIDKKQADDLKAAHKDAGDALRKELNITVSMLSQRNAPRTGADLIRFQPDAPAPPPAPKDKEEKKDDK